MPDVGDLTVFGHGSKDAITIHRRRPRLFIYRGMFLALRPLAKRAGAEHDRYRSVLRERHR